MDDEGEKEYISCPYCEQEDFDLEGLKTHFSRGYCDIYNNTESW